MTTPSGMNQQAVLRGVELRLTTALLGLQTAIPAGVTMINVGNVLMPVVDAIKLVQSQVLPYTNTRQALATLRQLSLTKKERAKLCRRLLADLKAGCVVIFGRESEELTKFGYKPEKPRRSLTIEQQARSAAKAKATRAKRHTMGSRQKAELKATETPEISIPKHGPMLFVGPGDGTTNGTPDASTNPAAQPAPGTGSTVN